MPRTDTLTHKELVLLRAVRDEYLKLGLATGRTDRGEAQAAISEAYAVAGLKPPKIWIWLGSPWAGCVGAWMISRLPIGMTRVRNQVWTQILRQVVGQTVAELGDPIMEQVSAEVGSPVVDQVWHRVGNQIVAQIWDHVEGLIAPVKDQVMDQIRAQVVAQVGIEDVAQVGYECISQVGDQVGQAGYGQHDAGWLAVCDVFCRMRHTYEAERLRPLMRLAAVAGWWWPFSEACIISERPSALHRDQAGRLHFATGAAAISGRLGVYAWHGLRVPPRIIENNGEITPDVIDAEVNIELRRAMCEIVATLR